MQRYGRFEDNSVVETLDVEGDITRMFHFSLDWRPVPAACVPGWRVMKGELMAPDHYKVLRAAAYPEPEVYLDALVKQSSSDPMVREEGVIQAADYLAACRAIKIKYPKV